MSCATLGALDKSANSRRALSIVVPSSGSTGQRSPEPSWVWRAVGPRIARARHRVFALDLPTFAGGIPGLTLRRLARLHVPRAVIWGAEATPRGTAERILEFIASLAHDKHTP